MLTENGKKYLVSSDQGEYGANCFSEHLGGCPYCDGDLIVLQTQTEKMLVIICSDFYCNYIVKQIQIDFRST